MVSCETWRSSYSRECKECRFAGCVTLQDVLLCRMCYFAVSWVPADVSKERITSVFRIRKKSVRDEVLLNFLSNRLIFTILNGRNTVFQRHYTYLQHHKAWHTEEYDLQVDVFLFDFISTKNLLTCFIYFNYLLYLPTYLLYLLTYYLITYLLLNYLFRYLITYLLTHSLTH
jgi:hypothetical protein